MEKPIHPVVAVVDSNCIGHICRHGMKGLTFNERQTGVIYGFMLFILRLAKALRTHRMVFCWDSRKRYRNQLYPAYKDSRDKFRKAMTDEEKEQLRIDFDQFTLLRQEILPELGFVNNFIQTGYEADDIIAKVIQDNEGYFTVVSSDQDLYQLIESDVGGDYCQIYNPRTKEFINFDKFVGKYNIQPSQWARVKAIGGCSSDGVPGVPGVAEGTALKYVRDELSVNSKSWQAIANHRDAVDLYKKLVKLPYPGMREIKLKSFTTFSYEGFVRVCDRYSLRSIYKNGGEWMEMFDRREA